MAAITSAALALSLAPTAAFAETTVVYTDPAGSLFEQRLAEQQKQREEYRENTIIEWPDERYVIDEERDGLPGTGYDEDSVLAYLALNTTPEEAVQTLSLLQSTALSDAEASRIDQSSIRAQSGVRLDVRYGYNVQEALDELYECPEIAYASPNHLYYTPEDVPPKNWGRLSGKDRYQTSARVCASAFDSAQTVIITSGENYPDALATSPLAGFYDAPILIVPAKVTLPLPIAREIVRLGATNAIVIGGTTAVSDGMMEQVELLTGRAERIAGADRIDTCLRVLERLGNTYGKTAIIVNGYNYPDALSIASYAYAAKLPIFLTKKDGTLRDDEIKAIKAAGLSNILIIGGSSVVSERVVSVLDMEDIGRQGEDLYQQRNLRLAGSSRYDTNARVVSWELEGRADITIGSYLEPVVNTSVSTIYVASGKGYADALSAAAAAGHTGSALLLIDGSTQGLLPAQVLSEFGPEARGYIVGGGAALSADTMRAFWNAAH